ncbi:MAG TPA: DUF3182 family protein [Planctomycetota bacterium]|nr:DUF3182 family protein [Planctomycetota bacterium]
MGHRFSPPTAQREVSFLVCPTVAREHELATQRGVAGRLAALLGRELVDDVDFTAAPRALGYAVPNATLTSLGDAWRWGIRNEADLFGGVVPAPFVATKTITHGLVAPDATAPPGWCAGFAQRVAGAVLPGCSAFSLEDARRGGERLLRGGPVRIKLAAGIGGAGQWVVHDAGALEARLAALAEHDALGEGLVLERHLEDVVTFSIGLLTVGALRAAYFGVQHNTRNRDGHEVYGGSSLTVTRGGFEALERLAGADPPRRRAVELARVYHDAALECFAGMFASRCNYDVVQGRDGAGRLLAGVLEQSWRIGGASGAEVAALEALRDDPDLQVVRASTVERYGSGVPVPGDATLYYCGIDEHLGMITKYARIDGHGDLRAEG